MIVLSTTYSSRLLNCGLSRAIFSRRHFLPEHFNDVQLINAWRVGRKLGAALVTFRYPKPPPSSDSATTGAADTDTAPADPTGTADTAGTGTASQPTSSDAMEEILSQIVPDLSTGAAAGTDTSTGSSTPGVHSQLLLDLARLTIDLETAPVTLMSAVSAKRL